MKPTKVEFYSHRPELGLVTPDDLINYIRNNGTLTPDETISIVDNLSPSRLRELQFSGIYGTETIIPAYNELGYYRDSDIGDGYVGYPNMTTDDLATKVKPSLTKTNKQNTSLVSSGYSFANGYNSIDVIIDQSNTLVDRCILAILYGKIDGVETMIVATSGDDESGPLYTSMMSASYKIVRFLLQTSFEDDIPVRNPKSHWFVSVDLGMVELSTRMSSSISSKINVPEVIRLTENYGTVTKEISGSHKLICGGHVIGETKQIIEL